MTAAGRRTPRLLAGVAVLAGLAVLAPRPAAAPAAGASSRPEVRALWVLRTSLTSPERIARLVRAARQHGFNTLLVQVRGRGDAFYSGAREPRAAQLSGQPPTFDPLAEVLGAAHAAGLRVHAWINVNLVSSATDLPRGGDHVVVRRPEWLMVPRDLARELARVDPSKPAYVARLARWTRAHPNEVEGLYASPIPAGAVEYLEGIVGDLTRRYGVDGVHFDYVRYPSDRFDYSRTALDEFAGWVAPRLEPARRRTLAAQAQKDVLAYATALPGEWRTFRAARMTALLGRLGTAVREARPAATVSVAAKADIRDAVHHRLQEWPRWLEDGLIDAVAPMAYTVEGRQFAEQIAAARAVGGGGQVWAGIGAYRLSPAQTIANIQAARQLRADGVVLFSYDSLVEPRHAARDYLGVVGRSVFAAGPALQGSR